MSNYDFKSKEEREKLRRAKMGDSEALWSVIFAYWVGHDEDIERNRQSAREYIIMVENLAKSQNRLAMGLVASQYKLYQRQQGPPKDYPLFNESLAEMCYSQLLKDAEAGHPSSMLAVAWYELAEPKTECFKYLLRSAEIGCVGSYCFLGLAF